MVRFPRLLLFFLFLHCLGCQGGSSDQEAPSGPLFQIRTSQETGVSFSNVLSEHPSPNRNSLLFEYFSNGAGIAIGDVNGDGWEDLYFSANMGYNRLYLNKGGLEFEDVTDVTGTGGRANTWKTGVAMADINGDGLLDLYLSYSGDLPLDRRIDQVLINKGLDETGMPQFVDEAPALGLANPHSSNQAYFFDADRDGDLDLFLLTHNVKSIPKLDAEETIQQLQQEDPVHGVRFYRNQGGSFQDVTLQAGFQSSSLTYGLGAVVTDVNNDGWPDLYVGNDYSPPDFLYQNNKDGTFTDVLGEAMGYTSNASMGIDAADVNNDGWVDLFVLDMLPPTAQKQKTLFIPEDRAEFKRMVESGFHHQYLRNTLQLNNGNGSFSEIAQQAGLSSTDWSWAPLIADFDNDGLKDIYITNGNINDPIDRDFLLFKNQYIAGKQSRLEPSDIGFLLQAVPRSEMQNAAFKNTPEFPFEDVSASWGLDAGLISTGAAYGDLDRDGDLDLVVNNTNAPASIYENRSSDHETHSYLRIKLLGTAPNTAGIGARISLYTDRDQQVVEQMPARGYLSSVSPILHMGLGTSTRVDSLRVVWPDGLVETRFQIGVNQELTLDQRNAESNTLQPGNTKTYFDPIATPFDFRHQVEANADDFLRQPFMDQHQSSVGPPLAQGDVNGDGLMDVFIGGGVNQSASIWIQTPEGSFQRVNSPAFAASNEGMDAGAAFFDADQDGDLDLYLAKGGYGNLRNGDVALRDVLFLNEGDGSMTLAEQALPEMLTSTKAVVPIDVDSDGLEDLFVGGYVVPGSYPESPLSYLLRNAGDGTFRFYLNTEETAFRGLGMVRDAAKADMDGDGREELIVVGNWMPVTILSMDSQGFQNITETHFSDSLTGLWNSVLVEDFNEDGRPDLLLGNQGLNTPLGWSPEVQPQLLYADFNNDGQLDPLLSMGVAGRRAPYLTLDQLVSQLPQVAMQFNSYAAYGAANWSNILPAPIADRGARLTAATLETALYLSSQDGSLKKGTLPQEVQYSPVFATGATDVNGDGHLDVILAGNTTDAPLRLGIATANYGQLLLGDGGGGFTYVPQSESGFFVRGGVRDLEIIQDRVFFGLFGGGLPVYRKVLK